MTHEWRVNRVLAKSWKWISNKSNSAQSSAEKVFDFPFSSLRNSSMGEARGAEGKGGFDRR